jgi:hypothetical protein
MNDSIATAADSTDNSAPSRCACPLESQPAQSAAHRALVKIIEPNSGKTEGPSYLLRGLIVCALCGRKFEGAGHLGGHTRYRCRRPGPRSIVAMGHPATVTVREDEALRQILPQVSVLLTPAGIEATVDRLSSTYLAHSTHSVGAVNQVARSLDLAEKRHDNLQDAIANGVSFEALGAAIEEAWQEVLELRTELDVARSGRQLDPAIEAVRQRLIGASARADEVLAVASRPNLAAFLDWVGIRATYHPDGESFAVEIMP